MSGERPLLLPESIDDERPALAGRWDPCPAKARLHYHENLEILWNRAPMTLVVGETRHFLRQPTVFILPAQTVHLAKSFRGRPPRSQHGSHLAIQDEYVAACGVRKGFVCGPVAPPHSAELIPLLEFIAGRLGTSEEITGADLKTLVAGLLCWMKHMGYGARDAHPVSADPVQRAVDLVLSRYSDPALTVGDLARAARVSAPHLRRLFVERMNQPPQRYINRVRMDRARHLMAKSNLKMAAVAKSVGYTSVSAMYRHLRRAAARTHPGRLRRINGRSQA